MCCFNLKRASRLVLHTASSSTGKDDGWRVVGVMVESVGCVLFQFVKGF